MSITKVKLCANLGYMKTRIFMKKKRYFFRGEAAGGDLVDTNEQELAKAPFSPPESGVRLAENNGEENQAHKEGETETDVCAVLKTDEEPALKTEEAVLSEAQEQGEELPAPTFEEALTHGGALPKGNGGEPLPKLPKGQTVPLEEENEEEGSADERSGGSRGYPYILLIALCFISALALVCGALLFQQPESEAEAVTDTAAPLGTDTADTSRLPSTGWDYSSRCRTSVGIRADGEDGQVCLSGVGLFSDGYIATVYRPALESGQSEVTLWNGKVYPAVCVGSIPSAGLSLLRISPHSELEYLSLSEISEGGVSAGEELYAIGSAEGGKLNGSLFLCAVSHSDRSLELLDGDGRRHMLSAIQLSGLAEAGLLGCPLFDGNGNGVALALSCGDNAEVCFAVSLKSVAELLSLVKNGEAPTREALSQLLRTPAVLGIEGKQACVDGIWGVEITGFSHEGDAEEKLRRGDLIFRIDDTAVASVDTLRQLLEEYSSGESAEIFVYRKGQRLSFVVRLE